jgi:long-subunit fatty acid transport protein
MRKISLLLAACFVAAPTLALADQYSLIGSNAESVAQGGAMTAGASGAMAVFYNPAVLNKNRTQDSEFSYIWAKPVLSIDRTPHEPTDAYIAAGAQPGDDAYNREYNIIQYKRGVNDYQERRASDVPLIRGFSIGFVMPLAKVREESRFSLGVGVYVPQGPIMRQRINAPETPYFVEFDDRSQRLVANMAVGWDITDNLRVGAGASLLMDIEVESMIFVPVQLDLGQLIRNQGGLDISVTPLANVAIPPSISPIGGVQWDISDSLSVGASYRHEVKSEVTANANISVSSGGAQPVIVPLHMSSSAAFTPTQIALGTQFKPLEQRLRLSADVTWSQWSEYRPPVAEFEASNLKNLASSLLEGDIADLSEDVIINFAGLEIPLSQIIERAQAAIPNSVSQRYEFEGFRDTITPRIGAAYDVNPDATLMAGYFYRPSIISPSGLEVTRITRQDFGDGKPVVEERTRVDHNTLDNDQHGFSFGSIYRYGSFRFGATLLYIHLVTQTVDKSADAELLPEDEARRAQGTQTTAYGYPGYTYGGYVLGGMFQAGFTF